jgi:hypothetical protein
MRSLRQGLAAAALLALAAGCASKPEAPAPTPAPRPQPPAPRPAPVPAPPQDWRDAPLTQGAWTYREVAGGSEASFAGAFSLRCDAASRQLVLTRAGAGAGPMRVRTTFGDRSFASVPASVPSSDRFLDSMVFSRGRIAVEAAGTARLIIPTWPEPARVLEDCRG